MNRLRFTVLSLLLTVGCVSCFSQDKATTKYNTIIDMLRYEPGVKIGPDAGPGNMPSIIIRGIGTNSAETQPIFIVDGIQRDNIMYLEPADVHSINVIKDGTTAIYGVQGANGVIEIKTKAQAEAEKRAAQEKKAARKAKKRKGNIERTDSIS